MNKNKITLQKQINPERNCFQPIGYPDTRKQ